MKNIISISDNKKVQNREIMADFADFEFEDDEKDVLTLLGDIDRIDYELRKIRFDSDIPQETKIQRIVSLFEERNDAYDSLQKARTREFRSFVDGLRMGQVDCGTFFPLNTRCKITVNNAAAKEVHQTKVETSGWGKMLHAFKSKKGDTSQQTIQSIAEERLKIVQQRQAELLQKKTELEAFPELSVDNKAFLKRIEFELSDIGRFMEAKK